MIKLARALGEKLQKSISIGHGLLRQTAAGRSPVQIAVEQGHHHRGLQAMTGNITEKDHLTTVRQSNELKKVAAQTEGHAIFNSHAAPVAGR